MGNLRSVANALAELGQDSCLVQTPEAVTRADKVILPGVGAFAEAIDNLHTSDLASALEDYVAAGKPLLGICLGMQLICRESMEDGVHRGLGFVDAKVVRFPPDQGIKVPHIGWSTLDVVRQSKIAHGLVSGSDVYFVHSYYVDCAKPEDVVATCCHGIPFCAIVEHDNVFGMQFHPEKSQQIGLDLLRSFTDL